MLILALFCFFCVCGRQELSENVENQIFASSASVTALKLRYLMQGLSWSSSSGNHSGDDDDKK